MRDYRMRRLAVRHMHGYMLLVVVARLASIASPTGVWLLWHSES